MYIFEPEPVSPNFNNNQDFGKSIVCLVTCARWHTYTKQQQSGRYTRICTRISNKLRSASGMVSTDHFAGHIHRQEETTIFGRDLARKCES